MRARIASLLKRAYPQCGYELKVAHKGLVLDLETSCARYKDNQVSFTKNEIKIMSYLFRYRGKIVQRADIIEYLWDNSMFVDDNALSVNITRIRRKLEELGIENYIVTKHGQGYMI